MFIKLILVVIGNARPKLSMRPALGCLAELQKLEQTHQRWPPVALLTAAIREIEKNPQQAIVAYTRVLEFGGTQPRVLATLVGLLLQRGELNQAETEIARYEGELSLTRELAKLGAEVALVMREKQHARVAV